MNKIKVSPSLLASDFGRMGEEARRIIACGADWIHCDVMDGDFVPNISFGQPMIAALRKYTDGFLDVHLMVREPGRYVEEFAAAGADMITVHAEACDHLHRTLQQIRAAGKKAGVALNPATDINVIEYVLPLCDMILCMSVNPGFGGQKLIPEVVEKIRRLSARLKELGREDIDIQIDGGVTEENAAELREAGVTCLVAGSSVFKAQDMAKAIAAIRGE
ncbi:MAG: ribulose-phosphate 3-epimerase [Clostridia bacterium]|nr:ribulose-phosphate 3-epimerase [Clostridia bacterium]